MWTGPIEMPIVISVRIAGILSGFYRLRDKIKYVDFVDFLLAQGPSFTPTPIVILSAAEVGLPNLFAWLVFRMCCISAFR